MPIYEFILFEAAKTMIGLATTAFTGWVVWLALLRYRNHKIHSLLSNPARIFLLYYRGDEDTSHKKRIAFNKDHSINDGTHPNECSWKIAWGQLVISTNGKQVYSRFKWAQNVGRLVHVNDPKLPSVMGQYIVPLYVPAGPNRDIYLKKLDATSNDR